MKKMLSCLLLSFSALSAVRADIGLSRVFSDNMVLQRGKPVPVWGWAKPGATVSVAFAGQTRTAVVGEDGAWRVVLDALSACKEGRALTVTETAPKQTRPAHAVTVRNVLVGEVWILSGQSNMQWTVNGTDDLPLVLKRADYPLLRYMRNQEGALAAGPTRQLPPAARWVVTTTNEVSSYSATGFYFGERLMLDLDVPVGLIMTACGGTSMANWTPRAWMSKDPTQKALLARYERENAEWIATNGYAAACAAHAEAIAQYAGKMLAFHQKKGPYPWPRPAPPLAFTGWKGNRAPCVHYDAKIAPLAGLAIAGVLWYQGETESWAYNMHDPAGKFAEMLGTLVRGWRDAWNEEIPFVVAQLPSMASGDKRNRGWPVVRCRQRQLTHELPMVGAAPILDSGWEHDVHPHDKTIVGERLARVARRMVYGDRTVAPPPEFAAAEFSETGAVVRFAAEAKLEGRGTPRGFQLKFGEEWVDAVPTLRADGTVFVASPSGKGRPDAVHYLWKGWDKPDVWLYDAQGVPVSSFSFPFMVW